MVAGPSHEQRDVDLISFLLRIKAAKVGALHSELDYVVTSDDYPLDLRSSI